MLTWWVRTFQVLLLISRSRTLNISVKISWIKPWSHKPRKEISALAEKPELVILNFSCTLTLALKHWRRGASISTSPEKFISILFSVWDCTCKIFSTSLGNDKDMSVKSSKSRELEISFSIVAALLGYVTCFKLRILRQGKETNSVLTKVTQRSRKCTSVLQVYMLSGSTVILESALVRISRCWTLRVVVESQSMG